MVTAGPFFLKTNKQLYSSCDQVQSPNLVIAGAVKSFSLKVNVILKDVSICFLGVLFYTGIRYIVCIVQAIRFARKQQQEIYWEKFCLK